MVSNINELVDEAVEIASQDFASVKVEKGEEGIKQEFLYLIKKVFDETEFHRAFNSDRAYSGVSIHEKDMWHRKLLIEFFACGFDNAGSAIKRNPLLLDGWLNKKIYHPLAVEIYSPKVFEKAQIFAKAYEHISGQKATIIKQFHEETVNPELEKIINSSSGNVKVNEHLHFRVARWIQEQGYEIAHLDGYKVSQSSREGIGILKPRKNFLGFRKTAFHVGNLYFNWHSADEKIFAQEDKRWNLFVYGKEFLNELTQNVSIISRRVGNIEVVVDLDLENPIYEKSRNCGPE